MSNNNQNKLGTMPVGKLLVSMAVPMMISFFIQALYNIVDSMFVAQISEDALTAVSLAYPFQMIMGAISIGTGVGINAGLPRAIAQRNKNKVDDIVNTGIFLNIVYVLVFASLGFFASHAFYTMQTDVQSIVDYGTVYLSIVLIICFGAFFGQLFEKMLTATGNANMAMISMASGAIFNIIFDPLLIFGIGPFPEMGIAGAALATVLGQILAAIIAFFFNVKKNPWTDIELSKIIHPSLQAAKDIYKVGFPSMITMGLTSMSSFFINQILLTYSTTATAVYGIWMKIQNFCYMPGFGLNNGLVPILSYNHGTRAMDRVYQAIRYAVIGIACIMLAETIVLECIPESLLMMFNASEMMLSFGVSALRFCIASLVFGGVTIVLSSAMQAMDHARFTLVVNVLRGFILPVLFFFILSLLFKSLHIIWAAVPITEITCFIISIFLFKKMQVDIENE